jgi:hypothetical protein
VREYPHRARTCKTAAEKTIEDPGRRIDQTSEITKSHALSRASRTFAKRLLFSEFVRLNARTHLPSDPLRHSLAQFELSVERPNRRRWAIEHGHGIAPVFGAAVDAPRNSARSETVE